MRISVLYVVVVASWGFSWYATELQLGDTPIELSISCRFLLASSLLFLLLRIRGRLNSATYRVHFWFFLLGLTLFCINFLCVYAATKYIPSGLVAVFFAFAVIFSALNAWLFLGVRPTTNIFIGSAIGLTGLTLLTSFDVAITVDRDTVLGGMLAGAGAYSFSLGGLVSARLKKNIDIGSSTAWAMLYGGATMGVLALIKNAPMESAISSDYLWGMFYLVVVASLIGFLSYVTVVNHIGPTRAASVTLLVPMIAMATSTVVGDIHWTIEKAGGAVLVLVGLFLSIRSESPQVR